jgi:hypothetical protein
MYWGLVPPFYAQSDQSRREKKAALDTPQGKSLLFRSKGKRYEI